MIEVDASESSSNIPNIDKEESKEGGSDKKVGGFFFKNLDIPGKRNSSSSGSSQMVLSPCFKTLSRQNSIGNEQ